MSNVDIPLYDVKILVEYFSNQTVIYSATVSLDLPVLLPGEANSFHGGGLSYYDPREVRATVVSWTRQSSLSYASLTVLSAQIKQVTVGGSYECVEVSGTVRNDHPFDLKDVHVMAMATATNPGYPWERMWFDGISGDLKTEDEETSTTIRAGATLTYRAPNGCSGSWPPEAVLDVVTQGVVIP